MFGANLRQLATQADSISALCRELGINRTQFNRYLSGESFPRPDVLHKICRYFDVDARILLEPVEDIIGGRDRLMDSPFIADFIGSDAHTIDEEALPSGFYRFIRRSFMNDDAFIRGLIYIFRQDNSVFLRGFEAKKAMADQGLPTDPATREFRGVFLPQEDGVAAMVSRRGATTASFNYLARVPSFENNFYVGYVTRTVRENVAGRRVERLVYEHLGRDTGKILAAARTEGFCNEDDLTPFQKRLLLPGVPFA
ncbi:helix-turn-helix domain-containing protein [Cognatishimia sp. F0-27]|uniref:helix-turn-helix domain-containing protein n=1 Tax=Cognatishimia sp. F0-27 TaxID=2816855 RepID=UPI001D0C1C31|nr:helix-turn-helix transcriptional regulator [Cognatishimia sp. F0-27]MCC1494508.1 helix-turn-helix transcriptional regulator [Cognatishimia sp. F0-27]